MRTTTILSVDISDAPGALGTLACALAERGVNIEGFSVEQGTVRFLTRQTEAAAEVLAEAGFPARPVRVFEVQLDNRPGALAQLAASLHSAGIQIINTFGISSGPVGTVYVDVDDAPRATPILQQINGARIAA